MSGETKGTIVRPRILTAAPLHPQEQDNVVIIMS